MYRFLVDISQSQLILCWSFQYHNCNEREISQAEIFNVNASSNPDVSIQKLHLNALVTVSYLKSLFYVLRELVPQETLLLRWWGSGS